MARETIEINKSLIPYTFDIELGSELFTFEVNYNNVGDFFTIKVVKNGETICSGEPLVYGRRLFEDIWDSKFPAIDIVPFDPSGSYNAVTYANLGDGVLLVIDNEETSVVGV